MELFDVLGELLFVAEYSGMAETFGLFASHALPVTSHVLFELLFAFVANVARVTLERHLVHVHSRYVHSHAAHVGEYLVTALWTGYLYWFFFQMFFPVNVKDIGACMLCV